MRTFRIAAIPGDGIGREVIAAGVEVLEVCAKRDGGFAVAFDHFDWGSERYKKTGAFMPENGRDEIKGHDAILFGSAGVPDVPDHITLWGLRLAICQPFDQYANVRPTRILPGITSPLRNVSGPELDWVIVRENSEGEYAGVGGRVHRGLPEEAATDVAMFTRPGVVLGYKMVASQDISLGRLVVPFGPQLTLPGRAYHFVCPRGQERRPSIKAFRDWLFAEIAETHAKLMPAVPGAPAADSVDKPAESKSARRAAARKTQG